MSVDGALLSDITKAMALRPATALFLLVTGTDTAQAESALREVYSGSPAYGFTALAEAKDCLASPAAFFRRNTVLVLEDIQAMWDLAQSHGFGPQLLRLLARLRSTPQFAVIASAAGEDALPAAIAEGARFVIYRLPSTTEPSSRLFLRPFANDRLAVAEAITRSLTPSSTQTSMLLALCMGSRVSGAAMDPHQKVGEREVEAAEMRAFLNFVEANGRESAGGGMGMPSVGGRLLASVQSTTGILLHGPSGCGKTALAHKLRRENPTVPFFFVRCSTLFSKYLGESEQRLREVYQKARGTAPAVVVLDDIDTIALSRGSMGNTSEGSQSGVNVSTRMLAVLLCELDGLSDNAGVLTIACSNAPHVIDAAVLRQGRLETALFVPPLSRDAARDMCGAFFEAFDGDAAAKTALTESISAAVVGCAPASLEYVLRQVVEKSVLPSSHLVPDLLLPLPAQEDMESTLLALRSCSLSISTSRKNTHKYASSALSFGHGTNPRSEALKLFIGIPTSDASPSYQLTLLPCSALSYFTVGILPYPFLYNA
eukprot:gene4345-3159_t